MNPATLELIATMLQIAERAYVQVRDIIAREKSGNPLSDAELNALKYSSDTAHELIQGWSPPSA